MLADCTCFIVNKFECARGRRYSEVLKTFEHVQGRGRGGLYSEVQEHVGVGPCMVGHRSLRRQTHTTENIAFATLLAGGKKTLY